MERFMSPDDEKKQDNNPVENDEKNSQKNAASRRCIRTWRGQSPT